MNYDDSTSLSCSSPPQKKTIRADIISNHSTIVMHLKFVLLFIIMCYGSHLLPAAEIKIVYIPEIWTQIDILDLKQISPLNRKIKVYIAAAKDNEQIDPVYLAEVLTLLNNEEKQRLFQLRVKDLDAYTDISQNQIKFYLGDVDILQEVVYRIKISKPLKTARMLANQPQQQKNQPNDKTIQPSNEENPQNQTETAEITQQQRKKIQEEKRKQEEEQIKKQAEERIKQQQQQMKRKQQQDKLRKEQQAKKKAKEEIAKIEEQKKRKIYQHTNIRIQAHFVSTFATFFQLVIRYISILIIIYLATDNPDAPKLIAVICALYSNPLLFLQLSFPNSITNTVDMFCQSVPYLYLSAWLYYIHTNIKYTEGRKKTIFLIFKLILGNLLFIINILRLLHYDVLLWQILIGIIVSFIVSLYIWQAFLNLPFQHHRDKILIVTTITFLGYLFIFKTISGPWVELISYIIIQFYGCTLIYLTGSHHKKNNYKSASDQELPHAKISQLKEKY